ncbi:MAG TPA: hypothetical protein VFJ61_09135 [Solirubrobacterales bacterium]|nr:hypothetical protein [Solirubrobacterales bacterium]
MFPVGSLINDLASGAGFVAACIAVCGFVMQVPPALVKADEKAVRAATVVGGIGGLLLAAAVIVLAAVIP